MSNIEDNEGLESLERSLTLGLDDKYDEVKQLMDMGKEKGYLLYDEVNDLLPGDVTSSEEMDDMFSMFRAQGIEVIDGEPKAAGAEKLGIEKEAGEDVELDLTPGALDKTNDPVRLYLREMGTVPLLTREGEVEIAKRIERGQLNVLKAMSRSPIVIKEVINLGDQLERGERSINDVIVFNEDMMTEEKVEDRLKETVQKIEDIQKSFKKQNQLLNKLLNTPKSKQPRRTASCASPWPGSECSFPKPSAISTSLFQSEIGSLTRSGGSTRPTGRSRRNKPGWKRRSSIRRARTSTNSRRTSAASKRRSPQLKKTRSPRVSI